ATPVAEEKAFFEALQKAGLELRMKDLQTYPGGFKKADWDVGMAVDAIRMANYLDSVILVTGDGDFVPLVEYLKWGLGRQVEVAAFGRSASGRLKESADYFINIEDYPKIIIKK
ncbi:MAG: NYN domain-containing protein, partial [Patescibacteria group bacterium]